MTRHTLIWGYLRLFLGVMQTSLAAAAILMVVNVGVRPITVIVATSALTATVISRLIYKGKPDPMIEGNKDKVLDKVQ
ncbi:MAG: hypothetical protein KME49_13700 [Brasilonema octagenarum HA4186-MV1]|jgi:hypothetical protein|nr:hypothetical protein [Brasilonema octagenarum HA4186-MV1]